MPLKNYRTKKLSVLFLILGGTFFLLSNWGANSPPPPDESHLPAPPAPLTIEKPISSQLPKPNHVSIPPVVINKATTKEEVVDTSPLIEPTQVAAIEPLTINEPAAVEVDLPPDSTPLGKLQRTLSETAQQFPILARGNSSLLAKHDQESTGLVNHGRIEIPAIDVDKTSFTIPLIDRGWDLEDLGKGVGLLEGAGQYPNDRLSMVFAGHVTTHWPITGAFGRIHTLNIGDEVRYTDGPSTYVYEISRFIYADPGRADLLFQENGEQIILVTCNGYNFFSDTFDKRLIAYADLKEVLQTDQNIWHSNQ